MNDELLEFCTKLEVKIQAAYEESLTIPEAEKLATEFLAAQMRIVSELARADLDRRMRKRGVKTLRSAARVAEVKRHDKKPTESALEDAVNLDPIVQEQEKQFDEAEVNKEQLSNYLGVFQESHIHFRGVAKS